MYLYGGLTQFYGLFGCPGLWRGQREERLHHKEHRCVFQLSGGSYSHLKRHYENGIYHCKACGKCIVTYRGDNGS